MLEKYYNLHLGTVDTVQAGDGGPGHGDVRAGHQQQLHASQTMLYRSAITSGFLPTLLTVALSGRGLQISVPDPTRLAAVQRARRSPGPLHTLPLRRPPQLLQVTSPAIHTDSCEA